MQISIQLATSLSDLEMGAARVLRGPNESLAGGSGSFDQDTLHEAGEVAWSGGQRKAAREGGPNIVCHVFP